jgi:catechol 2,3-dioxygenase-like lactoylglutathione lyase family enzyme
VVSIASIHHVNIRAPAHDIARLREFYCDVVGLREGWRPPFESRGHWLYGGEQPMLHLVEGEADASAAPRGVDHIAFRCADLEPVIERLRSRGIEFQLAHIPALGDRQLSFRDPLGIGVELNVGSGSG